MFLSFIFACCIFFFYLRCQCINLCRNLRTVKFKGCSIQNIVKIFSFHRCRIHFHQLIEIFQCATSFITDTNCFTQFLLCNFHVKFLLQIFLESDNFTLPILQCSLCLFMRKFQNKYIFKLRHKLIHFLFTITGSLSNYNI